jgi:hypothetical protein
MELRDYSKGREWLAKDDHSRRLVEVLLLPAEGSWLWMLLRFVRPGRLEEGSVVLIRPPYLLFLFICFVV